MITFTVKDGKPVCEVELYNRIGVYLDNDSLIRLANHCESRRRRFVDVVRRRGALLFSITNAIEIAGPQGASADAIRTFLNSIGPHWIPLALSPFGVARREQAGGIGRAPVSPEFMDGYVKERMADLSPSGRAVISLSEEFFQLGAVLDWVQQNRERMRAHGLKLDGMLREFLGKARMNYEREPGSLDRAYPPISFSSLRPANFALNHLLRLLVKEGKAYHFKAHDGPDFCHVVLASAYGSVATLDKHWKRRVEALPTPNGLAKIYYQPQLDEFVDLLESLASPN
jgi:hypothetical protein